MPSVGIRPQKASQRSSQKPSLSCIDVGQYGREAMIVECALRLDADPSVGPEIVSAGRDR
jgi:hypothetical protein